MVLDAYKMGEKFMQQKTLKNEVILNGVALHSGKQVQMIIKPAPENSGINFYRSDMKSLEKIPALYNNVGATHLRNTTIGKLELAHVQTIEHIMASLYIAEIDNADIFIDNQETPIMDGCAVSFLEAIQKVGTVSQNNNRKFLRVLKKVRVDENDLYVSLEPDEKLVVNARLIYPFPMIGDQVYDTEITPETFASEIAMCRTFGRMDEYEYLKSQGMARGASVENVIVIDDTNVLNPEPFGLRYKDEFVRHKIIDAVGDLYTSGYRILGRMESYKGSHSLNNKLLYQLFSDKLNYEIIE